mgnify:CR=1 FL=1
MWGRVGPCRGRTHILPVSFATAICTDIAADGIQVIGDSNTITGCTLDTVTGDGIEVNALGGLNRIAGSVFNSVTGLNIKDLGTNTRVDGAGTESTRTGTGLGQDLIGSLGLMMGSSELLVQWGYTEQLDGPADDVTYTTDYTYPQAYAAVPFVLANGTPVSTGANISFEYGGIATTAGYAGYVSTSTVLTIKVRGENDPLNTVELPSFAWIAIGKPA